MLQIYGVEQKDAGSYRCVATTAANRRKSTEAVLSVIPGIYHVRFFFQWHCILSYRIAKTLKSLEKL